MSPSSTTGETSGWTDERDETLRSRWGRFSAASIARTLSVSRRTLYRRAAVLGLTSSRCWTAEDDEKMEELLAAGWSDRRVGEELGGRSGGAVRNRKSRLRLRAEDWRIQLDVVTVAQLIGRHHKTVTSWLERGELKGRRHKCGWRVWPKQLREFVLAEPSRVRWTALGTDAWELVNLLGGRWGVGEDG